MISHAAQGTLSDWWDSFISFLEDADDPLVQVAITLGAAVIVWILGRLTIRGIVRGIREGIPKGQGRLPRIFRRSPPTSESRLLENRLEAARRERRADTIGSALRSLLAFFVLVIAVLTILSTLGVPVGPLVAGAGIVGVALGFGAQSLVKDLLAGMFILSEDQYGVGDIIDLGEAVGTVEEVGLRTTRLRSLDGTVWFVPNGEVRRVGNKSRLWSRAMVEIRVDPRIDVGMAKEALLEAAMVAIAQEEIAPDVLGSPIVPGVEAITRDSIVLRVFVQVRPGRQWDVERAIRAEVQRVFGERKIRLAVSENRIYMADEG